MHSIIDYKAMSAFFSSSGGNHLVSDELLISDAWLINPYIAVPLVLYQQTYNKNNI